ncbi:hypothetical protein BC941DRAFT_425718, partial [Chlamydoabsidia padenii]
MLNPGATEFKPSFASSTTDVKSDKTRNAPVDKPSLPLHQSASKTRNKPKKKNNTGPTNTENTLEHKPTPRPIKKSTLTMEQHESSRRQQKAGQKKPRRPQQTSAVDSFTEQPATSFITIDQTINPVHVVIQNTPSHQKKTVVHGYDHYVAWIERCLQAYPVITVVGTDPAIADVISLVTMVQSKGIGFYHELATFSMVEN